MSALLFVLSVASLSFASEEANHLVKVPLVNVLDSYYYLELGIGTPAQTFKFIPSSALSLTFVPSSKCPATYKACEKHRRFDSSKSSTYTSDNVPFEYAVTAGNVSGNVAHDDFTVGGHLVKKVQFGEATKIVGLTFENLVVDGTLALSRVQGSLVDTLFERNVIKKKQYALYLTRNQENGSEVSFGGPNPERYKEPFHWAPFSDNVSFMTTFNGFAIGNEPIVNCSKCPIIPDMGGAYMLGPVKEVEKLNKKLGGTALGNGQYLLDCATFQSLPPISMDIAGTTLKFTPNEYTVQVTQGGVKYCISPFFAMDVPTPAGNFWGFGVALLRNVYTLYDIENSRVGFATLR